MADGKRGGGGGVAVIMVQFNVQDIRKKKNKNKKR